MREYFSKRRTFMKQQNIHTTVNLSFKNTELLDKNACRLGMTRSRLVVLLMRKMVVQWRSLKRNFTSVKYQKNACGEKWKVAHVFFEVKDYEMFIDMRKFFKWSVSALVAMAINMYLDEIASGGKENLKQHFDNNKVIDYKCTAQLNKNTICWHIYWELDEKFAQKVSR